ncbi:unnamed protein product [Amoebophrya sp. A120]|nr:unnamed protein product [Amoebophrya sp. A120]|eukprot:GSA120T00021185001.1
MAHHYKKNPNLGRLCVAGLLCSCLRVALLGQDLFGGAAVFALNPSPSCPSTASTATKFILCDPSGKQVGSEQEAPAIVVLVQVPTQCQTRAQPGPPRKRPPQPGGARLRAEVAADLAVSRPEL